MTPYEKPSAGVLAWSAVLAALCVVAGRATAGEQSAAASGVILPQGGEKNGAIDSGKDQSFMANFIESLRFANLGKIAVPLRRARSGRVGRPGQYEANGKQVFYNPEVVLFRRKGEKEVSSISIPRGKERAAVAALRGREDVEFAALDTIQTRQFTPSDSNLSFQWHHGVIGSFAAWEYGLGDREVSLAIVDTPFQMNHPDLIENVTAGWDVVDEMPILSSAGDAHSTASAGMAAAVINNGLGVAGAANCRVVPIGINGATSEMYQAVLWAADQNIRVVNISWTGGNEEVLQAAGEYLKEHAEGVLVMPGLNGVGRLDYTNHPNILCVSMTDSADNLRSHSGPHIDFAAPGWDVYSTTTNSKYEVARGTSFAAPLFAGVIAMVMSINPSLTSAQVVEVMRTTADDKGNPGWDESYGWGRVNHAAAVNEALNTLPKILSLTQDSGGIRVEVQTVFPAFLVLERNDLTVGSVWSTVGEMNSPGGVTILNDLPSRDLAFYRVRAEAARE